MGMVPYFKMKFMFLCGVWLLWATAANAGQVTMCAYDFDEDYVDEIIRTDEMNDTTVIHIYTRIPESHFYKPEKNFTVPGRLVQVPEVADVNDDGVKEYYFATGIDMGIIYYDPIKEEYRRTNDVNFEVVSDDKKESKKTVGQFDDSESRESSPTISEASIL